MSALARVIETYRRTRKYGDLYDSPADRLGELLVVLFSSRELPNILLGGAITLTLTASWPTVALAWAIYALSVVNYVIAEEIICAARAARQRFDDDPRGIY